MEFISILPQIVSRFLDVPCRSLVLLALILPIREFSSTWLVVFRVVFDTAVDVQLTDLIGHVRDKLEGGLVVEDLIGVLTNKDVEINFLN